MVTTVLGFPPRFSPLMNGKIGLDLGGQRNGYWCDRH
jgi:hypothetical protein